MTVTLIGISTARLELVALEPVDREPLREAVAWGEPDAPLTGWDANRLARLLAEREPSRLRAAVRRGPTLVGAVLAEPRGRTLALDGLILPAWRGVGYAVELLGAIVDQALASPSKRERAFDTVEIVVNAGNSAAIRAARAIGFESVPLSGAPQRCGVRGDRVQLRAGPELAGRARGQVDLEWVTRLIDTLGVYEARALVRHNDARAARELEPPRRDPHDPVPELLRRSDPDLAAARAATQPGIDALALARAAAGLSDAAIADLQSMVRTSHSSATEYAESLAADALLRRLRKAAPR